MSTIHVPMERGYGPGTWASTEDLLLSGPTATSRTPHVVHFYDATTMTRREKDGPLEPGPYAFVIARYVVPDPAPPAHPANFNDLLEICGHIYAFHPTDDFIELDLVEAPVGAH